MPYYINSSWCMQTFSSTRTIQVNKICLEQDWLRPYGRYRTILRRVRNKKFHFRCVRPRLQTNSSWCMQTLPSTKAVQVPDKYIMMYFSRHSCHEVRGTLAARYIDGPWMDAGGNASSFGACIRRGFLRTWWDYDECCIKCGTRSFSCTDWVSGVVQCSGLT